MTGLLGPLLTEPEIGYVKGFYRRHLDIPTGTEADGGGRVTELMARPLLNMFWPQLAGSSNRSLVSTRAAEAF